MSKFWSAGSSSSSSDAALSSGSWSAAEANHDDAIALNVNDDDEDEDVGLDANLAWETIKSKQLFLPAPKSTTATQPESCTRIVCISDTHCKHSNIKLPPGDILVHGGDFTKSGEIGSIQSLSEYFGASGFKEVVCIAGNHDMTLHPEFYEENWTRFHRKKIDTKEASEAMSNCTYLCDSSCTSQAGSLAIHGSPWSPEFFNWAFNKFRGDDIRQVWNAVPACTDVFIVHGPPLGRGDLTSLNDRAGCFDLLNEIQNRIKPRLVVFGHIHEDAGVSFDGTTVYVNASSLDLAYRVINYPVVIDMPDDKTSPAMVVPPKCVFRRREFFDWLQRRGYSELLDHTTDSEIDGITFPVGNELFEEDRFYDIWRYLQIVSVQKQQMQQLRNALFQLYAESFPAR